MNKKANLEGLFWLLVVGFMMVMIFYIIDAKLSSVPSEIYDDLNSVCISKGYSELTDYNKEYLDVEWYRDPEVLIKIECDNKVIKGSYHYIIFREKTCTEFDKWNNCVSTKFESIWSLSDLEYR